jgi:hypothetical protein
VPFYCKKRVAVRRSKQDPPQLAQRHQRRIRPVQWQHCGHPPPQPSQGSRQQQIRGLSFFIISILIFYTHYDPIIFLYDTIIFIISLQFLDFFLIISLSPKDYYFTYDSTIMLIIFLLIIMSLITIITQYNMDHSGTPD